MRGEEFDSFVIEMDFQGIPYISILEEHEQGKLKIWEKQTKEISHN